MYRASGNSARQHHRAPGTSALAIRTCLRRRLGQFGPTEFRRAAVGSEPGQLTISGVHNLKARLNLRDALRLGHRKHRRQPGRPVPRQHRQPDELGVANQGGLNAGIRAWASASASLIPAAPTWASATSGGLNFGGVSIGSTCISIANTGSSNIGWRAGRLQHRVGKNLGDSISFGGSGATASACELQRRQLRAPTPAAGASAAAGNPATSASGSPATAGSGSAALSSGSNSMGCSAPAAETSGSSTPGAGSVGIFNTGTGSAGTARELGRCSASAGTGQHQHGRVPWGLNANGFNRAASLGGQPGSGASERAASQHRVTTQHRRVTNIQANHGLPDAFITSMASCND